ncbi:hypothetical protein [Aquimarina sp. 433]
MKLNEIIKNSTSYLFIIYIIGFLIVNISLSRYGVFVKDLFSLDYIKSGVLFLILFVAPAISQIESAKRVRSYVWNSDNIFSKWLITNYLVKILLSIIFLLAVPMAFLGIVELIFINHFENKYVIYLIYAFMITIISFLVNRSFDLKKPEIFMELLPLTFFIILSLHLFAVSIYPNIKFQLGGGAIYTKTILVNDKNDNVITEVSKVLYESEKNIYTLHDSIVITIPKNRILKEIFKLQE